MADGVIKYNSERDPTSDHSTKVWYKLSEHFKIKKTFNKFSIGFYVKLSSAVAAILVRHRKCRTQFWKTDYLNTISAKFGYNLNNSFRGEDF